MTDTITTQSPVIQVSLPGAGRSVTYRLTADALVRFTFDLADAEFIGNGNNLEIIVEGGGTIILLDYLTLAEANTLPVFEMLDGQQVEGGVYLFAFEGDQPVTEQDIETAAGAAASGSGAGEYTDDAGTLFDGLTALGGQGDAYDSHLYPTLDPIVTDLPDAAPIPPVAVDDVNRIVESGWNREEGENGHYEQEGPYSSVTGNLLLNDYDGDNIDYPETGGVLTELAVQTIDFPGEDFTGNNPGPVEVSDTGTQVNGQYGTLTVFSDGSYEYVLDETLADPLREGQEVLEQFEYTAVDPDGNGSNTATLTITVVGTNDAPDAVDDISPDVVEQGTEVAGIAVAAGNVLHNDSDIDNVGYEDLAPAYKDLLPTDPDGLVELGVTSIYSYGTNQYAGAPDGNGDFVVEGTYGTLTINSDGSYEYTLDQTKADPLNIGDNPTEFFGYSLWDGEKYDYAYLRIPVLGSNDAPVADVDVNDFTEAVDDAAPADVLGNVLANDTDVDNVALELSVASILYSGDGTPPVRVSDAYTADHVIEGEYGTLYLNNDGSYHYVEDKNATDPLNTDDPAVTDVFTYVVSDNQAGGALTDTATLTITIGGANDSPVATLDVNSFTEAVDGAAPGDVMGNILTNDTDIDNPGLELAVSDIEYSGAGIPPVRVSDAYTADHVIEGEFGTLYLNDDGSYHYVEDKSATDGLNSDDPSVSDIFTYEVSDNQAGGALSDTATLTITIGGANDTPVATLDVNSFTEAVDDAAPGDVMGNILTNDTDIDNSALELSVASILYSGDGTPPVRVSDAYTADHVIEGEYGTLYLNDDGSYHYVEDKNATDPLNTDDPAVTDVFTYVVSDNQAGGALSDTATLTITIGGANDTPVATLDVNSFTEAVDDAAPGDVMGNILTNDTDIDNTALELSVHDILYSGAGTPPVRVSDAYTADHVVEGEYGTLYLNDDGSYHYVEDKSATDGLNSDDPSVSDIFTYEVSDNQAGGALSDTATLTITISGANDSPVAAVDLNAFTEAVDDAAPGDVMGNILTNDTDIDNTDIELSVASILYSGDGTPPVRVSDAYTADHVIEGEYGTLYLNNDGSYHYVEDKNATDPLNTDDPAVTDVFTYEVSDNQAGGALSDTATLTITISGANDSPAARVNVNGFTEAVDTAAAADVMGNILTNDGDIDNPGLELAVSDIEYSGAGIPPVRVSDAYTADHVIEGEYGTLYLNNDGSYHYVEDKNATDPLNTDDPAVTDVFTYEVSDNQAGGALTDTATLTITISGANDSPVATLDVNSFTEAVDDTAPGDVMGNILTNDTDIDNTALELSVASILYSGDGTPPVRVSDAYTADHVIEGEYGTLYLNNDGSYHYVEDKDATDPLNSDDPAVNDVFTYEVSDNQAGGALTDTATLTITIGGANDTPVATLDVNGFTEAVDSASAHAVSGNVLENDTDVDNVDLGDLGTPELTVSDIEYSGTGTPPARPSDLYIADHIVEGEYGTLYLNDDGSYVYVEDKAATDPLNTDDPSVTDVFTYEVSDNQAGGALSDTATLTITISGANDSPVATLDVNSFTEAVDDAAPGDVMGNILTNDTDIDNTALELSVASILYSGAGTPPVRVSDAYTADHVIEGEYGTLYLNDDGSYHYVEDKNATDPLNTDDPAVTDVFTYVVTDNQTGGALTDTATLTITIGGANDSPVATLDVNSFTEAVDGAAPGDVTGNILTNDTDIDNPGLELAVSDIEYSGAGIPPVRVSDAYTADHVIEGQFGTLYLNNDGSYHYVEDKNATDPLNTDDPAVTDVFTYEVSDNQAGGSLTATSTLTITINGANDSPVATLDVNSFTEAVDDAAPGDVMGNILTNDTDIDNTALELSVASILYSGAGTPPVRVSDAYTADHVIEGEYGTLYLNDDGSYHYVEDKNATDWLNSDDPAVTDVFTYEVSDNQAGGALSDTATLTITIGGANDSPVATVDFNAFTEAVDDAAPADVIGNILTNDTDIDNAAAELSVHDIQYTGGGTPPARVSDAYTADHVIEGEYGTLYLNNDGSYHYVEDKGATDWLNSDDPAVTDVFTYEVSDNQAGVALTDAATLTITISGANDSPVASIDVNSFTEAVDDAAAGDVMGNVLTNDTDVDNTALELSVSDIEYSGDGTPPVRVSDAYAADHVIEGEYGTLYLNNDGSYHYVEDKAVTDPLNVGDDPVSDVFTYEVSDNQAGGALTDTATLTITIDPANDTPIAVHDGSHEIFITNTVETVIDDWSGVSGSVIYGPGYTVTAESFDAVGDPISDVQFTTWGNDQHLGIYTNGSSDDQKVDDQDGLEQITFEFDDPQSSFSIEFIAQGNNHVNAWVYPVGGGAPVMFENVGNAVYITPGFEFDTIVFIPDGSFGMESLTTVTGGENLLTGTAEGNVLANDYDVDNVTFDDATAGGDMSAMELFVSDIDSGNVPGNSPSSGSDLDGDYYVMEGEFGSLKIYETGEWSYTPNEEVDGEGGWQNLDHSATDVFVYTVSDGLGGTDTAAIEVSLNVNTTGATGGSGTLSGTAGNDVLFPADGDTVSSGAGNDAIVIDPVYLGDGPSTVDVTDFSDHDRLVLGNMEGANVEITSNSNDVSLVFSDIDGSDDITVNLLGVAPVNDAVDQTVEITTSDDLNQLIQTIIDSGNNSIA